MELLYRFCTLKKYVEYDKENFKILEYHNSIEKLIDCFAEEALYFSDHEIEQYKNCLESFIKLLNISKENFQKISLIEGLFVVLDKTKLNLYEIDDALCAQILKNNDIKDTQKGGTISQTNMNKRWKRIYDILSGNAEQIE